MRNLHFLLASTSREGNRLFVAGRNCGDAVACGDVLTGLSGSGRVEAILTYRRRLNILDSGMTGELELHGEGMESIEANSTLFGRAECALPAPELLGAGEFHVKSV